MIKINFAKNKKLVIGGIVLLGVVFVAVMALKRPQKEDFQFGKVTMGDIKNKITCTGILDAKGTVEVGSQVSGTIDEIFVDYNDSVKKNQTLAVLDTLLLKSSYQEALSNYQKIKAKSEYSYKEYGRAKVLYEKKMISNKEYSKYFSDYLVDKNDLDVARSLSEKAKINLSYSRIKSPINGIVIDKNVEVGQTVASNFQTPTFFVIAENIEKMKILVSVDESDISSIKVGQKAEFTVNAYPDSVFYGTVNKIRLNPKMVQNVVTYIVVVETTNKDKILLPGMTATVDFIISEKKNVMMVQKSATKFVPTEMMKKEFAKKYPEYSNKKTVSGGEDSAEVWFIDKKGNLMMDRVRTGSSDDTNIEIVQSGHIKPGMRVIVGIKDNKEAKSESSNKNILTPSSGPGGGGGAPPPGGM
jgi:HlyD family secretion protein